MSVNKLLISSSTLIMLMFGLVALTSLSVEAKSKKNTKKPSVSVRSFEPRHRKIREGRNPKTGEAQ